MAVAESQRFFLRQRKDIKLGVWGAAARRSLELEKNTIKIPIE